MKSFPRIALAINGVVDIAVGVLGLINHPLFAIVLTHSFTDVLGEGTASLTIFAHLFAWFAILAGLVRLCAAVFPQSGSLHTAMCSYLVEAAWFGSEAFYWKSVNMDARDCVGVVPLCDRNVVWSSVLICIAMTVLVSLSLGEIRAANKASKEKNT